MVLKGLFNGNVFENTEFLPILKNYLFLIGTGNFT